MQVLLDAAFDGKIQITEATNTPNGVEGKTAGWTVIMERFKGSDLTPVWRLMQRRQEQTGQPVLGVLLDEQDPSTEGPLQLVTEMGTFPGLVIYRFGTDRQDVLQHAPVITQLYRLH